MSPSTRKRPKNRVVSKMQDEKLQDKINQPVSKLIERSRLKTVLKNLSLLKLLKSSNSRIKELHSLARRCWNSIFRVPKILQISCGDNSVCETVKHKPEELPGLTDLKKKVESIGDPNKKTSREWKPVKGPKGSPTAAPKRKKQPKRKVLKKAKSHGLYTRAKKRKQRVKKPRVVLLKTYYHRISMGDTKPLNMTDQVVWFEGLPTRIHRPGPRIMCRASTLRPVRRFCTRLCSASL